MHRLELDDIETVREDAIGLALQQVLRLVGSNVRHSCEHIGTVGCRAFDAVSVVDTSFARLVIDIEVLEVVVEINAASAEIPSEKRCVGGKNGGHVNVPFSKKGNRETSLPLVEVGDHRGIGLGSDILSLRVRVRALEFGPEAYLAQEPSDDVAKYYCFVRFMIVWRRGDSSEIP